MTGSIDTSIGGKLRAIFLAFVMIVSVFGATVAFSGSVAGATSSVEIATTQPVQPGETTNVNVNLDDGSNDVLVGIDADQDGDIQTNEILVNTNTGLSTSGDPDNTFSITPSNAPGIGSDTDASFDVVAVQESNSNGNIDDTPIDVSSTGGGKKVQLNIDGVGPTVSSVVTRDTADTTGSEIGTTDTNDDETAAANNGQIDTLEVTFSESIQDSSVDTADISITETDFTVDRIFTGSSGDDASILIDIEESGSADTDATPTLSIDSGNILDTAGNSISTGTTISTDGAAPSPVNADNVDTDGDTNIEAFQVTLSEPISDSASSLGNDDHVSLDSASLDEVLTTVSSGGSDDETVFFTLSSDLEPDATTQVDLSGSSNTPFSDGSNANNQDVNNIITTTDVLPPQISAAQTTSIDSNGNIDEIQISLSEPLEDTNSNDIATDTNLDAGETDLFRLSDGAISGFSDTPGGNDDATTDVNGDNDPDVVIQVTGIAGSSATPDITFEGGSKDIGDTNNVVLNNDQLFTETSNGVSSPLAGGKNSEISTEIDGLATQNVLVGNASQDLGLIRIRDKSGGNSPLAATTNITLPEGITINEQASDFTITTTSGNLAVTNSSVTNNGRSLVLDHGSTSSDGGQTIRIQGTSVDVAPNVSASRTGVSQDLTVSYAIGSLDTALLTTEKASVTFPTSPGTFGAGTTGQALQADTRVQAPDDLSGGIAGNSELVITANQSNGITFDTDIDPTAIPIETGGSKVDMSSASISSTSLTIPVTSKFASDDVLEINTDDGTNPLQIDLTGEAQPSQLTATFRTNDSTGRLSDLTQSGSQISIDRPEVDYGSNNVGTPNDATDDTADPTESFAVGRNTQFTDEPITIETVSDGQIRSGSDVIITTNRSDVTFDTSVNADIDGTTIVNDDQNPEQLDVGFSNNAGAGSSIQSVDINEDSIVLTIDSDATEDDDIIALEDIPFNVASSVADEARVSFNVTTSPSAGTTVLSTEDNNDFANLERPNIQLNNDNNVTVQMDNDGITKAEIDPNSGDNTKGSAPDNALIVTSDTIQTLGDTGQDTDVVVSLPSDSGVTFDQDKSANNNALDDTNSETNIEGTGGDEVSAVAYTEGSITLTLNQGNLVGGDAITFDQLFFNATSTANNVSISVTTEPDTDTDSDVTTTDDNDVKFTTASPDNVFGDAVTSTDSNNANNGPDNEGNGNGDYGGTDTAEASATNNLGASPKQVGETFTSSIYVDNGNGFSSPADSAASGAFGNTDVDLSVVESPDGSSGASFNESALTTNSDGTADFEFTLGDVVGTYVVNASTSAGGVNITYEATSGQTSQLNVTQVKDGLATGTDSSTGTDTDVAIFRVRTEDSGGNIAPADVDFGTVFTGGSASVVELYEDYQVSDGSVGGDEIVSDGDLTNDNGDAFDDGDGDSRTNYIQSNDDNGQAGVFFVAVAGSTEQTVDIELAPESGDISSGSATADLVTVNDVDVAINDSTTSPESTVTATATPQSGDGDVTVPRLSASFSISNTTVATFDAASSVTTNVSGVATANLTAEENGTATVSAITRNRQGSATITVEEAGTESASVTFNDQSVQNGTEEVTVASANYTLADGSEGDYVVVMHVVNDDGSISSPVGASSDQTGSASDITVDLNDTSAAFEDGDALDTLTENTTLRAMLHETSNDSAFGPSLGLATDDADITVTPESPIDGPAGEFDADADGDISITELGDAGTAFAQGELTIAELGAVGQEFAS